MDEVSLSRSRDPTNQLDVFAHQSIVRDFAGHEQSTGDSTRGAFRASNRAPTCTCPLSETTFAPWAESSESLPCPNGASVETLSRINGSVGRPEIAPRELLFPSIIDQSGWRLRISGGEPRSMNRESHASLCTELSATITSRM